MPTLRSHTHPQAAQANAPTKAYKRVWLPNRTDTTTVVGRATTEKEGRTHNSTLASVFLVKKNRTPSCKPLPL